MNTLQKIGYVSFGLLMSASQTLAATSSSNPFGDAPELGTGNGQTGEQQVIGVIQLFLSFVTLIAVVYVLWAGFRILTGGSDEKAMEQGKKMIINVVIGIVIMWLAYAIVSWVVTALMNSGS